MAKRVTKKLRKAQEAFQKRVVKHLTALGAMENNWHFVLQTQAGALFIHVYEDWIAQRFDNAKAGYALTRKACSFSCSPYNGKWNYHYFENEVLTEDCENDWKDDLERLSFAILPAGD